MSSPNPTFTLCNIDELGGKEDRVVYAEGDSLKVDARIVRMCYGMKWASTQKRAEDMYGVVLDMSRELMITRQSWRLKAKGA